MSSPQTKPASEHLLSALRNLEANLPGDSALLVTRLTTYVSTAIPVVLWLERRGVPITWQNVLNLEYLDTEIFNHGGKHGILLNIISRPMRLAFKYITDEDLSSINALSDNAKMSFGYYAMHASNNLVRDDEAATE